MESFFHMCTQVRTKDFARVQMRENKRVISNTVNFFVSIVTYLKYNNDVIIFKKKNHENSFVCERVYQNFLLQLF
jgi:hypothetical protein